MEAKQEAAQATKETEVRYHKMEQTNFDKKTRKIELKFSMLLVHVRLEDIPPQFLHQ